MSDIYWIKITTNIFDDEKIRLIETLPDSDMILIIWLKLLTLAGKCNDCGLVYVTRDIPYNEEMLATIMRRPINTIRLALNEFEKLGMIRYVNGHLALVNWEKHQNVDKLELVREQARIRQQNYRERQKQIPCNVTVTQSNAVELELELDKNKSKNIKTLSTPTPEEVQAYLNEKQHTSFTGQSFCDFYSSRGWMIGKYKMKDWKAAVRTWISRSGASTGAELSIAERRKRAKEMYG